MKARKLRNQVIIQKHSTTQDAMGQRLETWTDIVTTRVDIDHSGGREFDKTSGEHSRTVTNIWARYQDKLSGLKQSDRVLHGTVAYDIQSINNVRERNKDLLLVCERSGS